MTARGLRRCIATATVAAAVVLGGCAEDEDELGRSTVSELARTTGTALGLRWTGGFLAELRPQQCDCPTLDGLSLCFVTSETSVLMESVQADGSVWVRFPDLSTPVPISMSGPLDDDDSFDLGLVADLPSLVSEITLIGRMNGDFAETGDIDSLGAELQLRVRGAFVDVSGGGRPGGPVGADDGALEQVDCRQRYAVDAVRLN